MHGVHPLDLLEQDEVERGECLSIRDEYRFHAGLWLSFYPLDERELFRRYQACALVPLQANELIGPSAFMRRQTSQGTGLERILLDCSSSQPLATREMEEEVIAGCGGSARSDSELPG